MSAACRYSLLIFSFHCLCLEAQIICNVKEAVPFSDDAFGFWKFQVSRRDIAEQEGEAVSTQDLHKVVELMKDPENGLHITEKHYLIIKVPIISPNMRNSQ